MLENSVKKEIQNIRPLLQSDGGDVEFVRLEEKTVYVRLTGTCGDCPFSDSTLKMRIEKPLKKAIPEIESVKAV